MFYNECMTKEKCIVKLKKALKIGLISTLSALTFCGCSITDKLSGEKYQDYSENSQITAIAQALDCDTGYLHENFRRMEHNNGEPIYVCFDSSIGQEVKDSAIRSLDYLFGIVGSINDNYYYEVVDKTKFDDLGDKSKIYYDMGEGSLLRGTANASGFIRSELDIWSMVSTVRVANDFKVTISEKFLKTSEIEDIYKTCVHELLHAFGFNDVYYNSLFKNEKYRGDTFMNTTLSMNIKDITPNDLKCLIALYAPEFENLQEQENAVKNYKEMVAEYENAFYYDFAHSCRDNIQADADITLDEFTWKSDSEIYVKNNQTKGYDSVPYTHEIVVKNGNYNFNLYEGTTLIDKCAGEAYLIDGVMVLKNVDLKEGFFPAIMSEINYIGDRVQDLGVAIRKGTVWLVDLSSNSIKLCGDIADTLSSSEQLHIETTEKEIIP